MGAPPCRDPLVALSVRRTETALPEKAWTMTNQRILLIDDDATLRLVLEQQLRRAGYDVLHAADGFAGCAAASAHRPALIVLDIMMTGIDGLEVCRRLKAAPATATVPVVFLSGSLNQTLRAQLFALGAADVLRKPDEIELLLPTVEAVLRRQRQPAPAAGRVVTLYGVGAANRAIDLAEAVALHSTWPVLLIDLDLQCGAVGARLTILPNPDCVDLLEHAPVPLTRHDIAGCAQQLRQGLGVVPAPNHSCSHLHPERIPAALAELRAAGYYVVVHAGAALNRVSVAAMRGAELTCAVLPSEPDPGQAFQVLLAELRALGVDHEAVVPVSEPAAVVGHFPRPHPMSATAARRTERQRAARQQSARW